VSAGELAVLREALDLPLEDLVGGARRPSLLASLAARVAGNESSPEFAPALGRAGQLIDLMDRVSRRSDPHVSPWWTLPTQGREKDRGTLLAQQVRQALGLANADPIVDLPIVCEQDFGLAVSLEPLPVGLRGLIVSLASTEGYDPDRALALVDTSRQEHGAQRFTTAHELAHMLFRDFDGQLVKIDVDPGVAPPPATRLMETKADAFAAEFLAPLEAVTRMLADVRDADDRTFLKAVARMAMHFGISWHAAGIRASEGDPKHPYQWFKRYPRDRTLNLLDLAGEWSAQPAHEQVEPPPLLLNSALTRLGEGTGGVTIFDVASMYRTLDVQALNTALSESGWLVPDYANA
jgi:hypothetical protein